MREESVVNLDDIQTISLALLERPITQLDDSKMSAIRDAIIYALGL